MENSMDKSLSELKRNIRIRTQQGEVEVNGARHNRPGVCLSLLSQADSHKRDNIQGQERLK